jgi:hypothetical protein
LGAIYPSRLRTFAAAPGTSLRDLFKGMPLVEVHEIDLRRIDPHLSAFMRINHPESYNEALAILKVSRES